MNLLLFICWLLLIFLSFHKRKDLFSPMKIYLLMVLIFWGDAFLKEYDLIVYVYFLCILFFALFIYSIEGNANNITYRTLLIVDKRNTIWLKIWLLTIIPVIAQIILIQKMGGIEGYIHSIGLRVVEWQGLGTYMFLTRTMLIINLLYFILIVKISNINRWEKLGFLFNLVIYIIISLLSGSRSTLLVNFILMFIVYYYYVKKVSFRRFIMLGITCLSLALVLGVARNGYSYKDGELKTGFSDENTDKKLELASFSYGLFPLEIIMAENDLKEYHYGMTYITAVTHIIPRSVWADKPPSGGVVFTNDYYNIHGGYSNYSTGFIVEGILNWGYIIGPIFAFLLLMLTYTLFVRYYTQQKEFISLQNAIIFFLIYPNILFILPTYLHGEFTTVTHAIFIYRVLPIILFVKFVIPKNIRYKEILF